MNTIYKSLFFFLCAMFLMPLTSAQRAETMQTTRFDVDQVEVQADATVRIEAESKDNDEENEHDDSDRAQSHNSSRSNRTESVFIDDDRDGYGDVSVEGASLNTNICDGVTCPDGSCAATMSECATEVDESPVCGVGGDTDCDDTNPDRYPGENVDKNSSETDVEAVSMPAQNHNSSRSNRTRGVTRGSLDPDDDGDGILTSDSEENAVDVTCPVDQVRCPNGACAKRTDLCPLPVAPGKEMAEKIRSMTPAGVKERDEDSDDDGLEDGDEDDELTRDDLPQAVLDYIEAEYPESYFEEVESDDEGFEVKLSGDIELTFDGEGNLQEYDDDDEDDNEDEDSSDDKDERDSFDAEKIRRWSDEEKQAFLETKSEQAAENHAQKRERKVTEKILEDENIESVEGDEDEVEIEYKTSVRLFGFIPMNNRADVKVRADGTVDFDYPWYGFLSTKPNTTSLEKIAQEFRLFWFSE